MEEMVEPLLPFFFFYIGSTLKISVYQTNKRKNEGKMKEKAM